jgi:uncharacterized membrane protein
MLNVISIKSREAFDVAKVGRFLFAVALIGFGAEHFIFGQFATGRAPSWSTDLPGEILATYFAGVVFIITGVIVLLGRNARMLLFISAIIVLIFALAPHLFVIFPNVQWGGEFTMAGKALTLFGGLLAVAGSLPAVSGAGNRIKTFINSTEAFHWTGRICLSFFLAICGGIQHFIFIDFVKTLVPSWIPGDVFWSYFAGIALMAGGIGLLLNRTLYLAGVMTGIMIFIWFLILHIPLALNAPAESVGNEWIAVCESLAFSAIAFVLAGTRGTTSER